MIKNILILTKLHICNLWQINTIRYSKDTKKRNRYLIQNSIWLLLAILLIVYIGFGCYALFLFDSEEMIFPLLIVSISALTFFFSIYKAGNIIFNRKTYDALAPLPVSDSCIVCSRFLSMYIQNMIITGIVVIPIMVVYTIFSQVHPLFYLLMLGSIFMIPLFPMTVATIIGGGITTITARMKYKNIVTICISLVIIVGILLTTMNTNTYTFIENIDSSYFKELLVLTKEQIYHFYPLARWFSEGIINTNIGMYSIFVIVSVLTFLVMLYVMQWKFKEISIALYTSKASTNYQLSSLAQNSVIKALYKKELKLFFSSNIYVINNSVGYLLLILFSIAVCFTDINSIQEMIPYLEIPKLFPFLLALMGSITTTTTAAISIEGKYWWLNQSLPISMKQIMNSKLAVSYTIAIPCYLIAEVILLFTLHLSVIDFLVLLVYPLSCFFFTSIFGLYVNCRMPLLQWESETVAVKQGGAILVTMIAVLILLLIPLIASIIWMPYITSIILISSGIMIGLGIWIYCKNQNLDIRTIQ